MVLDVWRPMVKGNGFVAASGWRAGGFWVIHGSCTVSSCGAGRVLNNGGWRIWWCCWLTAVDLVVEPQVLVLSCGGSGGGNPV